jgi:hypothetical protein
MRRIGRDQKTRAIGGPEDIDNLEEILEEDEGA